MNLAHFEAQLTAEQLRLWNSLDTPYLIQQYLDRIPYRREERDRSPLNVLRDNQSHCLDGGLFAAAALHRIGFPALILDLVPEPGTDDDHVLAIFQQNGLFGAVAKSNFSGLRFREPVFRSLRELVMSYFEVFFNEHGQKTLRGYTRPMRISPPYSMDWLTDEAAVARLARAFYRRKMVPVLPAFPIQLNLLDERSMQSGMLGTNRDELYPGAQDAPEH